MKHHRVLINYATKSHTNTRGNNTKSGMSVGNFDRAIEYSPDDLDDDFRQRNRDLLSRVRGAGYWIWKTYVILKTLNREDIADGDFIFYSDSDVLFLTSIDATVEYTEKSGQFLWATIWLNNTNNKCRSWVKRDMFILTDCDSEKYYEADIILYTYIGIIKCKEAIDFFRELLKYAEDTRIITDDKSTLGENLPEFKGHLHDQSLLSLLIVKHGLKPLPIDAPSNLIPASHIDCSDYGSVRRFFHNIRIKMDMHHHLFFVDVKSKKGRVAYYLVYGLLFGVHFTYETIFQKRSMRNLKDYFKKEFKRFFT